jgi:hypothetical protein
MTDNEQDIPLEPWLQRLAHDALDVEDSAIPRELMWARIRQQRANAASRDGGMVARPARTLRLSRTTVTRVAAIAATLVVGVAIGRYGARGTAGVSGSSRAALPTSTGASTAPTVGISSGLAGNQAAGTTRSTAPAVVAMEEHLARTVALLTTVRDESPTAQPGADVTGWARELLGTTRLLLDEPQLKDDRTRRLLQDLELVLVQIVQARGTSGSEARRAPSETMRETNLLPRVRAAVTASVHVDESSIRGIAE